MDDYSSAISFGPPLPDAVLGDRVAFWVFHTDVFEGKTKRFISRRVGRIIALLGTNAVFVEDDILYEVEDPLCVGRDMIFIPGDEL